MSTARIIENVRKTTQSGKAQAGRWTLMFEREEKMTPDPLTGWAGSGDTETQIRLTFPTLEEAQRYCEERGIATHVVKAPPHKLKIQAYADNFK
ncbi:NADH dehydrogenase ubiquinone Fe-S protein 4 [Sphingomicrobium arenosum]|uniref:NADH dehydrogenase ubiquinone Fe-S protein 4 n=1 Tax=Sphingomicrobium arenosum TaxID=2233861 RepID=UPI002240A326|nr:NADH dehydrogenase ubiquinone Fe-S protein 4 [Sphingomicrobium arenosum]